MARNKGRTKGNHEGSIRQRSTGLWEARLVVEGKSQSFYAKTREAVNRKLTAAIQNHYKGIPLVTERQTVKQYLEQWIEHVKPEIKPSSWRRYHDDVCLHLVPEIGPVQLSKLSAHHVQALKAARFAKGLSGSTVRHVRTVLHRALKDAMRLGLATENVTERVRAPRKSTGEMHILTEEQAQQFLEAAKGDRYEAFWVLALTTGMREGELLGLSWPDTSFDRGTLRIRQALQENPDLPGHYQLAEPKTARSKRTIALTSRALDALEAHRERQNKERATLCEFWDNSLDLVFPSPFGRLMHPTVLRQKSFYPILKRAGLPRIRPHDLRHTATSIWLARGVNIRLISEMLGHSDIRITLATYSHLMPGAHQAAIGVMDDVFGAK